MFLLVPLRSDVHTAELPGFGELTSFHCPNPGDQTDGTEQPATNNKQVHKSRENGHEDILS